MDVVSCRNCDREAAYDVVLAGEREVAIRLCEACHDDYADLGWIDEATPR